MPNIVTYKFANSIRAVQFGNINCDAIPIVYRKACCNYRRPRPKSCYFLPNETSRKHSVNIFVSLFQPYQVYHIQISNFYITFIISYCFDSILFRAWKQLFTLNYQSLLKKRNFFNSFSNLICNFLFFLSSYMLGLICFLSIQ